MKSEISFLLALNARSNVLFVVLGQQNILSGLIGLMFLCKVSPIVATPLKKYDSIVVIYLFTDNVI